MTHRKLAGAAVLAFAVSGLVLSWISAHAATVTLEPITISAPAVRVAGRDTLTDPSLQQIRITAKVKLHPATLKINSRLKG